MKCGLKHNVIYLMLQSAPFLDLGKGAVRQGWLGIVAISRRWG